jgi:hypothetical protein
MVSDTGLFRSGALDANEIHPRMAGTIIVGQGMLAESTTTLAAARLSECADACASGRARTRALQVLAAAPHPTVVSRSCKLFFRSAAAASLPS